MQRPKLTHRSHTHSTAQSRREFLTKTAIFTGGILACGWPFLTERSHSVYAAQSARVIQTESTIRYVLELDGATVGPLQSLESGFVSGEIISYQDGNSTVLSKRLGRLKYEDIVLTFGANMSGPFFQWIAKTLNRQNPRKNGAIAFVNQNGQIIERRELQNALIKEVVFPGLDVTTNEPTYWQMTVTPERIGYQPASGQAVAPPPANQSGFHTGRFRLQIQGLEQACAFVQRIEPFVVKQEIISYRDGGSAGESRVRGGRLQVGNVVITIPYHQAGPFTAWFSAFVLQGQLAGNTKHGVLEWLSSDGQTVLATLALNNLGIFRMAPVTREGTPHVQIEMYCETAQLTQFPGVESSGVSQQTVPRKNTVPFTQQKVVPLQPKSRRQPRRQNLNPSLPQK
ncbi:MAG: phage tail protein [Nitrospirota bacterium]|nr:phage tail protein [Nitrospirota bacterium]MDH5585246.1 phage tail protein [Nitrospirota bacterium]MDH5773531.1 phage tail protein [Nitrospirota bacterium]